MRTYIFTPLERRILMDWLDGRIPRSDIRVRKILSRVRLFKDLAEDVDLYLRVREAISTAST
jgi:hypothetical protein